MALTKPQWEKKLKSLVPSWLFEIQDGNASAIFKGMAAVLERAQSQYLDHVKETYIDEGSQPYVALQGLERGDITQLDKESLDAFRVRVKSIINKSNLPAIKKLVDSLLINGECVIIEHHTPMNFCDRGGYLNRLVIDFTVLYNAFTILIDDQSPDPETFASRGYFLDMTYAGSGSENSEVFTNIMKAVNQNKAYGTVYRLIERAPT
jgi:hypothetical protein